MRHTAPMTANPLAPPPPDGATPAMAQWFAAKALHPDAILFFRMGDFYEMFFADAEAAAVALDIALSHRGTHNNQPIPMCGVPVHAADAYLHRLIRRGFRVAVGEQMEEAKARIGKNPIRREVVRLVTPGTLTEDTILEATRPNLLLALARHHSSLAAAWLDISTGTFETQSITPQSLPSLLARLDPAEILAPDDLAPDDLPLGDHAARRTPSAPPPANPRALLEQHYGIASLDAFGSFTEAEIAAAALALDYVRATQAGKTPRLSPLTPIGTAGRLEMDAATRQSLEITRARDGSTTHTLLAATNRTHTSAGARLLADWLNAPLTDPRRIAQRQDAWAWLRDSPREAAALRAILRVTPDIARALARLSLARGSPRDLAAIRDGTAAAAKAATLLAAPLPGLLAQLHTELDLPPALHARLHAALADPVPIRLDPGTATIAPGFDAELDAERTLRDDSRRIIAGMQLDFAQAYGVASLKIKHHQQLGYVIEAPAIAVEKLRAHAELTLRQGMANGARFTHPELSELDRRISEAAERAAARERAIFAHLVEATLAHSAALAAAAQALATLDVAQSAARLAEPGTWCRPEVLDTHDFLVRDARHPVVEAALAGQAPFVPNDCDLAPQRRLLLLTGPNMAGKSTFLRQNALIAILAHAGLPVPARSARIGIIDRLFSRVGASDDLARGRSTFMVEMVETAAILHQATAKSLVIVDEIGRGTSTLDGLAIAWAVLEALHDARRCRTIFATHFHELARLTELPHVRPHTMRVKEWKQDVVFLHEVAEGAGGRSWGVHVARLAGVPAGVVKRAGALLTQLEARAGDLTDTSALPLFAAATPEPDPPAPPPAPPPSPTDPVHEALAAITPDSLTPREALDALYRLQGLLLGASAQ